MLEGVNAGQVPPLGGEQPIARPLRDPFREFIRVCNQVCPSNHSVITAAQAGGVLGAISGISMHELSASGYPIALITILVASCIGVRPTTALAGSMAGIVVGFMTRGSHFEKTVVIAAIAGSMFATMFETLVSIGEEMMRQEQGRVQNQNPYRERDLIRV